MMVVPFSNISMVPGSWDPRRRCLTVLGEGDNSTSMATGERRGEVPWQTLVGGKKISYAYIYIYIFIFIYIYLFIYSMNIHTYIQRESMNIHIYSMHIYIYVYIYI